ncbi:fructose transport system substrate-binding protein [Friedmanniella endophytica]|uniref:Fructose transport system substrate-binding protein n=1 Tax=Microlunatus kandeliicorticis TaxID=1759536 RepID=A0A7W3IU20_9ACTN|nr:substrate-binding domain-containing protein [Microlunatus kandeliicorticis]MBA8795229.1 fructose transport system substrate-binding protein [Microlunatus kandeliicorticis]
MIMALVLVASVLTACSYGDKRIGISLILKTQTNPYFVAMKQAAVAEAAKEDIRLSVAAGTQDGDTQNQINEIYTAIARGDKGILITSNGNAINAALRQAKKAGLFVIALDTPLDPSDTANITFATDNFAAGKAIGAYTAARLNGAKAVIAMLDLYNDQVVAVDTNRDHGFLTGMGINPGDQSQNGLEPKTGRYTAGKGGEYQVVCHRPTQGAIDGGRTAMEQCLAANPNINVVYSINEPAGEGGYNALVAAGKAKQAIVVTIDGSCHGIDLVQQGIFAADSTQYPGKMAQLGIQAIAKVARGGAPPQTSAGKSFFDTGTALATNTPQQGVTSQTPADAKKLCWGSDS